jgi:hypothetical protein
MPRPRLSEHERRLEHIHADYQAAKARLDEVGFTCEGSLVERYTSCNNPNCRCSDPAHRHGPYWQLSWKEGGRTVSRLISAEQAQLYQDWIANRRRLETVLAEMRDLSRQAGEHIAAAAGQPFHGPAHPRSRRRTGGQATS